MTIKRDLDHLKVEDAMRPVTATVTVTQKIEEVAKLFGQHRTHALPVVNEREQCVGVITTHDLVGYQSQLPDAEARIDHGMSFDLAHYNSGEALEIVARPFDQVDRHMTSTLQTIDPHEPLRRAAEIMCRLFIHHLIVLDSSGHPVGLLSPIDILAQLLDLPLGPEPPAE